MIPQLEAITMAEGSFIRNLHICCESFQQDHSWHCHPEFEITYIAKGEGTRFIGDSVERFYDGDLLLLGPDVPHCWVSAEHSLDNEMHVLQFNIAHLGNDFWKLGDVQLLKQWLLTGVRGIHFSRNNNQKALTLFNQVANSSGLMRLAKFWQLMVELMDSKDQQAVVSDSYSLAASRFKRSRLSKAITYIRQNLACDIKQADVAEVAGLTPQSFSRFFKANTGRTFVAFVNQLRIAEVCRLLETSDADIADIAYRCGYNNISNFNRRFVEYKHLTPSQYRQTLKMRQ